ncbi:MAG TPA: glycoside hydrolase family 15 protein [Gaiellaceae bacterium]|nr:glycoside hydrolase family 15 protein [Gaiellaceae bacterium]
MSEHGQRMQGERVEGYAPLRDYAALGDGRTVALVARDGAIDWLPLPDLDSATIFAAILDASRGGRFTLAPEVPHRTERRYLPDTNVLETTFVSGQGTVRLTDALTLPDAGVTPYRELQRKIEGLSGHVPMRWRVEPRFGYSGWPVRLARRHGLPIASSGSDAIALRAFEAGEPHLDDDAIAGRFEIAEGGSALLALASAHQEPLVVPSRDELDRRLEATCAGWRSWATGRAYQGPWREAVVRSALALKLLVYAPSGAIAAAATASLPEEIGGERNWDYRYSWIRDSAFAIDAFLQLGCPAEADAYFWWLMHATQLTHPRLHVLYRVDGGTRAQERELPFAGYRDSRPVNIGNGAVDQVQLDTYGELMQTVWLYTRAGNRLDRDVARRFARIADHVCANWREPDAGIWEVRSEPLHFTQSKMLCAVALDRAAQLADRGQLPDKHIGRWRQEAAAIRDFVDTRCWSVAKRSYMRFAGADELDASLLLAVLHDYAAPDEGRIRHTVDAVARELADGPYVRRYTGDDGLAGDEGAFVACSFWLAEAFARTGRIGDAVQLMEQLLSLANDVGLYSEEIDPDSGEFLGNMPQGLSHLALISAASAIAEVAQ